MELIKENIKVNQIACKGSAQAPLDEDIIVPDVKPDILKILQLDTVPCVTSREVTAGRVVVSGKVDVKLLYIPDSDREKIKSIVTEFDFSQNIDSGDISEDMTALIISNIDRAEVSLTNSRKLRVKIVVGLDYEIVADKEIEIAVDAMEGERTELMRDNVKLQNCVGMSEEEFSVRESIQAPNGQTSVNEILKVDAKICDCEYKSITGKIVAKGAACVCVLYTDDDCEIQFMEEEIPFTEVFDCDDAGDETICDIDYSIAELNYEVMEDSDGDRRIVDIDITVSAQIKAAENVSVDMVSDCYEPFMKTQLLKEEVELDEIVARPVSQNTIREMVEVSGGAPAVSCVYNVITRPFVTRTELQRGKLLAEGRIEAYILYLTEDSDSPVYSLKKDIPFSYMLECGETEDNLVPEIKAEIKHTAYNLNVAGEIELRCILSLSANIIRKRKIELITGVETEKPDTDEKKGIVVYFVQKGDNLWEVSKRYAVPREKILKFNSMTDTDKLVVGSRLFIPGM